MASSFEQYIVGTSVPRKEGRDKVTGAACYVDDMRLPGMLYGATVRSKIARGKISQILFDPAIDWKQFVALRQGHSRHNYFWILISLFGRWRINHPKSRSSCSLILISMLLRERSKRSPSNRSHSLRSFHQKASKMKSSGVRQYI